MSCPCDARTWPIPLAIAPGARSIVRQQFDFAGLRTAMFDRVRDRPALALWSARERTDYGVMLLELWAYTGEILAIYDQAIANESYVRTSALRPSLRRLVELLGYHARPATAATVELAAFVDGVRPVTLPIGTAFRSGSFGDERPQIFELTQPATIHPALDRWTLATPIARTIPGTFAELLADPATLTLAGGETVAIEIATTTNPQVYARKVVKIERVIDEASRRVVKIVLDREVAHQTDAVELAAVRLLRPRRAASLKSPSAIDTDPASFSVAADESRFAFVLDGVYPEARANSYAIVQRGDELRWCRIDERAEERLRIQPDSQTFGVTFESSSGPIEVAPQPIGPIRATYTALVATSQLQARDGLATSLRASWSTARADELVVHVGLEPACRLVGAPKRVLEMGDPLVALDARAPVGSPAQTRRLLLRDAEEQGVAIDGVVELAAGRLVPGAGAEWPALAIPVEAFGNAITAVRGETVTGEVIGTGDATSVHQEMLLAKKPLTYVAAPSAPTGVASTLRVWVDGLEWFEVPSLFDQGPLAQVFIIRHDDDERTTVKFGDGVRGSRLPTGAVVVASYRFGAGAAKPPGGSIQQVARPAAGLRSVLGPVSAIGGADRESASSLRSLAPRSAMLLGRAISIEDMEVAALGVPGVITARAEWTWDGRVQRPVVKVWIIGDLGAPAAVTKRLRALSDPSTPIRAEAATPVPTPVAIDLEVDPRRVAEDVLGAVRAALVGEDGALSLPRLGIGSPVLRSRLVADLLDMSGVTGVRGLSWGDQPLLAWGVDPGAGRYFDLGDGPTVTGGAA